MIACLQQSGNACEGTDFTHGGPVAVIEEGGGQADTCSALLGAAEAKFCGDFPCVP